MDVDSFLKLQAAQISGAEAEADIAGKLVAANVASATGEADVLTKYAQIALIQEQVVKAHLENVAKYLSIVWDSQAHTHLLAMRNMALRRAQQKRQAAEVFGHKLSYVGRLLKGGGTWDGVRDGWLGFEFVRDNVGIAVLTKAAAIEPAKGAYDPLYWLSPLHHATPPAPESFDAGSLLDWARQHTLFPVTGSFAWQFLAAYLDALSHGAAEQATALEAARIAAENSALELCKLDWARLAKSN